MSDDRNEVRRAHARITDLEEQLEELRTRPLSSEKLATLIRFIDGDFFESGLAKAFGITEDQLDEAIKDVDAEIVRQHAPD